MLLYFVRSKMWVFIINWKEVVELYVSLVSWPSWSPLAISVSTVHCHRWNWEDEWLKMLCRLNKYSDTCLGHIILNEFFNSQEPCFSLISWNYFSVHAYYQSHLELLYSSVCFLFLKMYHVGLLESSAQHLVYAWLEDRCLRNNVCYY